MEELPSRFSSQHNVDAGRYLDALKENEDRIS